MLEVVSRYKPESQQETFDVMNLLEERLKHSNSAVVLGATKVFLNLTQDMPTIHSQVYARLKAPMLTLMTGGIFEQGFVCLKHIALLTTRAPAVFADAYKHFFCRFNDPVCVKLLKLEILTTIAMVRVKVWPRATRVRPACDPRATRVRPACDPRATCL